MCINFALPLKTKHTFSLAFLVILLNGPNLLQYHKHKNALDVLAFVHPYQLRKLWKVNQRPLKKSHAFALKKNFKYNQNAPEKKKVSHIPIGNINPFKMVNFVVSWCSMSRVRLLQLQLAPPIPPNPSF